MSNLSEEAVRQFWNKAFSAASKYKLPEETVQAAEKAVAPKQLAAAPVMANTKPMPGSAQGRMPGNSNTQYGVPTIKKPTSTAATPPPPKALPQQVTSATAGMATAPSMSFPMTFPDLSPVKGSITGGLKTMGKHLLVGSALTASLLGGITAGSLGKMGVDILREANMVKTVLKAAPSANASFATRLANAAKASAVKDSRGLVAGMMEAGKLPDLNIPVGTSKEAALDLKRNFLLDMYKSKDEAQFINHAMARDNVLTADGKFDPIFLEGASKFAPNFAKKYGLPVSVGTGTQGKLSSVDKDLQSVYKRASEIYGGSPQVTQGNRAADYQNSIYKKDRFSKGEFHDLKNSPATYADGYIYRSDHQSARAIDVHLKGKAQNEATGAEAVYGKFNDAMQQAVKELKIPHSIEWGGTYSNKDYGHFGLIPNKPLPKMISVPDGKVGIKGALDKYEPADNNLLVQGYQAGRAGTVLGEQVWNRKIAPLLGMEKEDAAVKSMIPAAGSVKDAIPNIMTTHTDASQPWRTYHSQILDMDSVNFGVRNRGEHTPIDSKVGLIGTTYEPLARPQEQRYKSTKSGKTPYSIKDTAGVIGVADDGKFVKGQFSDFKNRTDVRIADMPMNRISSFDEDSTGQQVFKNKAGFKKSAQFPVVNVLKDDGTQGKGSLPFVAQNKNMTKYGQSDGGRIIFENPDTKKTYLVSGSLQEVKQSFNMIKGNSKYLNSYLLDTGTYVRGLSTQDGKISGQQLRDYDNLNFGGGGNGFYVKNK